MGGQEQREEDGGGVDLLSVAETGSGPPRQA
jgi:hypothetical protein